MPAHDGTCRRDMRSCRCYLSPQCEHCVILSLLHVAATFLSCACTLSLSRSPMSGYELLRLVELPLQKVAQDLCLFVSTIPWGGVLVKALIFWILNVDFCKIYQNIILRRRRNLTPDLTGYQNIGDGGMMIVFIFKLKMQKMSFCVQVLSKSSALN